VIVCRPAEQYPTELRSETEIKTRRDSNSNEEPENFRITKCFFVIKEPIFQMNSTPFSIKIDQIKISDGLFGTSAAANMAKTVSRDS